MDEKYFMIKINNAVSSYKKWVGWSNSGFTDGFYLTTEKQCKIFSSETFEEDEKIKSYLNDKEYELVPVLDVANIRESRIYIY